MTHSLQKTIFAIRHLKKVRNSMIDRGAYFANITAGWMIHFGKVNFIVNTVR